jgi:transcription elongation factor Elf1
MAEFTWPCPSCGQQQRKKVQAGEALEPTLCAVCAEFEAEAHDLAEAVDALDRDEKAAKRKR